MRKNPRRILSPQRLPFRHPGNGISNLANTTTYCNSIACVPARTAVGSERQTSFDRRNGSSGRPQLGEELEFSQYVGQHHSLYTFCR